jgi:ABC-type glutathione transport system ATPase component
MSKEIVAAERLGKRFHTRRARGGRSSEVTAVDNVSFSVLEGESVGIVGESGAGKTTIARCVLGLESPTSGVVRLFGRDTRDISQRHWRALRRDLQAVFQDPLGAMNPRWTVARVVAEPLRRLTDADSTEIKKRLSEVLTAVGLDEDLAGRLRHQLSGGQQQRACIARALSVRPRCLVLDEPVASLDASVKREVVSLLANLRQTNRLSYILISHDLRMVPILCDRVLVLLRGRIVEMGPTETVMLKPRHPYTRELVSAQLFLPGDKPAVAAQREARESGGWDAGSIRPPLADGLVEVAPNHYVAGEG